MLTALLSDVIFFIVYLIAAKLLLPYVIQFLLAHGVVAENFRRVSIPTGLGLYLWIMLLVYLLSLKLWSAFELKLGLPLVTWGHVAGDEMKLSMLSSYVLMLTIIFIVGWLDDSLGDRTIKGLRGHWRKWWHENVITTGLIKAGTTVLLAIWVIAFELGSSLGAGVVQVLIICLTTNAMNLLDLRPGRALKGFLIITLLLLLVGSLSINVVYLFPITVAALFIFVKDLRGQVMLGDAGANFIGFALGINIVISTPWWFQGVILLLLGLLHWFSERGSITDWIESNQLLHWFDQLGRGKH